MCVSSDYISWEEVKERQKQLLKEAEEESEGEHISIHDIPLVTISLVLLNITIFIVHSFSEGYEDIVRQWGFTPSNVMQLNSLSTFVTHMFLHADIFHLFVNMFILFSFGSLSEYKIGRCKFLVLYFASGISAALFHAVFNLESKIPCIGASGAVFGILTNYALLYPERPLYLKIRFVPVKVPSIIGVFFVFLLETIYALVGINPYIAHTAHIGGGIAGVILTAIIFHKETIDLLKKTIDLLFGLIPLIPEIRRYEDRDFDDYAATLEKTTNRSEKTNDKLRNMIIKVSKEQIWVADVDGKAVGFMILAFKNDNSLEIKSLDVHPDFQPMDIIPYLIRKAIDIAEEKKSPFLYIYTAIDKAIIGFLVEKGFEVVDYISDFHGKETILLKKKISK